MWRGLIRDLAEQARDCAAQGTTFTVPVKVIGRPATLHFTCAPCLPCCMLLPLEVGGLSLAG